jgi:hypothetical protein
MLQGYFVYAGLQNWQAIPAMLGGHPGWICLLYILCYLLMLLVDANYPCNAVWLCYISWSPVLVTQFAYAGYADLLCLKR